MAPQRMMLLPCFVCPQASGLKMVSWKDKVWRGLSVAVQRRGPRAPQGALYAYPPDDRRIHTAESDHAGVVGVDRVGACLLTLMVVSLTCSARVVH